MRFIGKFKDFTQGFNGDRTISFTVDNYLNKALLEGLDNTKDYAIEIKEVRHKRSIQQNRYMWLLLAEISQAIDGTKANDYDYYIYCLEKANAKFDYIACLKEAENTLKENFRAVKYIKDIELNGKQGAMYKVFIGSSKMDTKEMTVLIDTVLDLASKVGIDTGYWSDLLK